MEGDIGYYVRGRTGRGGTCAVIYQITRRAAVCGGNDSLTGAFSLLRHSSSRYKWCPEMGFAIRLWYYFYAINLVPATRVISYRCISRRNGHHCRLYKLANAVRTLSLSTTTSRETLTAPNDVVSTSKLRQTSPESAAIFAQSPTWQPSDTDKFVLQRPTHLCDPMMAAPRISDLLHRSRAKLKANQTLKDTIWQTHKWPDLSTLQRIK